MKAISSNDNEQLLALLKEEGVQGFTTIYRRFWPELFNTAYKRLKDKELCQDVVQNVFTDLWSRKQQVTIGNLSAYLHTAVRFQVYSQLAKKSASGSEFYTSFENILESPFRADDPILSTELVTIAKLWFDTLPEKRKQIFLMHHFENLSTLEIAQKLNISQKTVQNQLNTANTFIKAKFADLFLFAILIGVSQN